MRKVVNSMVCMNTYIHTYIHTYIFLLFLFISLIPVLSQAEPYWVEFLPGYPEGTPPIMTVQSNSTTNTIISITIPGMWVEDIMGYNGQIYQKLELPDCLTLTDVGMPALPTVCGCIGYYEESDTSIQYIDGLPMILENYNVIPYSYPPDVDEYRTSYFSINNDLYNKDAWWPINRAIVSPTEIMRDVPVSRFGVVPFEYDNLLHLLKVYPTMTVNITHTKSSKGGIDFKSSGTADPSFIPMYENIILNYDYLGLQPQEPTEYDYLIVTVDNANHRYLEPALRLKNFLENEHEKHYRVDILCQPYFVSGNDVRDKILERWNQYKYKYVLLIGNNGWVPLYGYKTKDHANQDVFIYGDYYDSLTNYPFFDAFSDFCIGRLNIDNVDELNRQIDHIIEHYRNWDESRAHNNLLVADIKDVKPEYGPPHWMVKSRIHLKYENYPPFDPDFTDCFGKDVGNDFLIQEINKGPMLINYKGHGWFDGWYSWNYKGENFTNNNIKNDINTGGKRPILLSITCHTGEIQNGNCFCNEWVRDDNAGIAAIGATMETPNDYNDYYDYALYCSAYTLPNQTIGLINSYAKNSLLIDSTFNVVPWGNYNIERVLFSYVLLGDPSLEFQPRTYFSENYKNINIKKLESNKITNKDTFYVISPTSENVNLVYTSYDNKNIDICIFDISGRMILSKSSNVCIGENKIDIPLESNISSGVYLIRASDGNNEIIKRFIIR